MSEENKEFSKKETEKAQSPLPNEVEPRERLVPEESDDEVISKPLGELPAMQVLEPREHEEYLQEQAWEEEEETSHKGVIVGGVIVMLVLVVAVAIGMMSETKPVEKEDKTVFEEPVNEEPEDFTKEELNIREREWYSESGEAVHKLAMELLQGFMAAKDTQAKSEFVREPYLFQQLSQPGEYFEGYRIGDSDKLEWNTSEAEGYTYLTLKGWKKDFTRFDIYFVRVDEVMKIDWQASMVRCDQSIKELKTQAPTEIVTVRCVMERDHLYDDHFNDKQYGCYLLSPPENDGSSYIWAYARIDSGDDWKMRNLLNYGMFNMELKERALVTLKLKAAGYEGSEAKYEIVEFLHGGWIKPQR